MNSDSLPEFAARKTPLELLNETLSEYRSALQHNKHATEVALTFLLAVQGQIQQQALEIAQLRLLMVPLVDKNHVQKIVSSSDDATDKFNAYIDASETFFREIEPYTNRTPNEM